MPLPQVIPESPNLIEDVERLKAENRIAGAPSKWADAIDADLRAEIALLAEAIGYVREVGGPKYRKAHTK
jgi:hypothetical protein